MGTPSRRLRRKTSLESPPVRAEAACASGVLTPSRRLRRKTSAGPSPGGFAATLSDAALPLRTVSDDAVVNESLPAASSSLPSTDAVTSAPGAERGSVSATSGEASGQGQQRGRGRRGSGAASAAGASASGGAGVTDSARAETVSAPPPEVSVGVHARGGRGAGSLSSGSAPVVSAPSAESSVASSLVVMPGARGGSKGRGRGSIA